MLVNTAHFALAAGNGNPDPRRPCRCSRSWNATRPWRHGRYGCRWYPALHHAYRPWNCAPALHAVKSAGRCSCCRVWHRRTKVYRQEGFTTWAMAGDTNSRSERTTGTFMANLLRFAMIARSSIYLERNSVTSLRHSSGIFLHYPVAAVWHHAALHIRGYLVEISFHDQAIGISRLPARGQAW